MGSKPDGRWLVIEDLLERGDRAFVDEIRRFTNAEVLGNFAERWLNDRRPASRRLLLEYLDQPLNAFRHNALIKRLFKRAEVAGDDQVMARFLVLFDRSVRRVNAKRVRHEFVRVATLEEAEQLQTTWTRAGYESVGCYMAWPSGYQVWRRWSESKIQTPNHGVMPQGTQKEIYDHRGIKRTVSDWNIRLSFFHQKYSDPEEIPDTLRAQFAKLRLFTPATRYYLRRRAWRYFRQLGKKQPERYIPAITEALLSYRNPDVADGLALLDDWSLMHILFHHSSAIVAKPNGWRLAPDRSLAELEPAPMYPELWDQAPSTLFELMTKAQCRTVRSWALAMIAKHRDAVLAVVSLEEWLALLNHEETEIAAFAAEALRDNPRLKEIPPEHWLKLIDEANPSAVPTLAGLLRQYCSPAQLTLEQAVGLASQRSLPLARLGFDYLRTKKPRTEGEGQSLLTLVEAEAEPLRPEIVRWVRETLTEALGFRPAWILEYLDSRHRDVREQGWIWFRDEPKARNDVDLWQRLLESPYDDVQLALVNELENRFRGRSAENLEVLALDPETVRFLWASVLLNIHRGGRTKPVVLRQLVRRLRKRPEDLPMLLPLLAISLRSTRGPEWRAGLAAIVELVERNMEAASLVRAAFPELHWT